MAVVATIPEQWVRGGCAPCRTFDPAFGGEGVVPSAHAWPLDCEAGGEVDPSDEQQGTAFISASHPRTAEFGLHDFVVGRPVNCGVFRSICAFTHQVPVDDSPAAEPRRPVIMTSNVSRHTHTHTHTHRHTHTHTDTHTNTHTHPIFAGSSGLASLLCGQNQLPATCSHP